MTRAIWNGVTIAEANDEEIIVIEGNKYFPRNSVNNKFLIESNTHTTCPWKGKASYFTINIEGNENSDAAWYYPEPKEAAKEIKGYVAFWKGVKVE